MPRAVLVGGVEDGLEFVVSSLAPTPLTAKDPNGDLYELKLHLAQPVLDQYGRLQYVLKRR